MKQKMIFWAVLVIVTAVLNLIPITKPAGKPRYIAVPPAIAYKQSFNVSECLDKGAPASYTHLGWPLATHDGGTACSPTTNIYPLSILLNTVIAFGIAIAVASLKKDRKKQ